MVWVINNIARNLMQISEHRYKVIFLFKGLVFDKNLELNKEFVDLRFIFMKNFYKLYVQYYWNNYYTKYQMMKNAAWEFYDSSNNENLF